MGKPGLLFMFQSPEFSGPNKTQSCKSLEHRENIVIWNWSKNLPWWLLASLEEPRKIGLSFSGCRKHCWDGFSEGILLLHFPSQSVTKPHPENNGHGAGDWNLILELLNT